MSNVNFYLKKAEPTGKALIFLRYFINGKALTFSFGQSIEPKNWNSDKQRVKNNRYTTQDGQHSLNDLLDNLERICKQAYHAQVKDGTPQLIAIKHALTNFINQKETVDKPTLYDLIQRFINKEIKHKGKSKSKSTIRTYVSTLTHLKEFEEIKKYQIDFDTITLSFYYDFISYLENLNTKYKSKIEALRKKPISDKEGKVITGKDGKPKLQKKKRPIVDLDPNTIGKYIKNIKVFMGEGVDLGYTNNMAYLNKKFIVPKQDTDAVYLSEKDIDTLYKHDFSHNKRLERVRDLFVFGCYVGLRFQDYSTIKKENIKAIENEDGTKEYYLKIITQKTQELVFIPCNPVVLEIFEKYGGNANRLPVSISNQNFNEYIKEACQLAELKEVGRLLTEPEKELWECVSSHTARRSFATNYYLDGFPTIDLMKITGHKTEKAFLTYIRVSKFDTAKRLNEHMKRRWEEKKARANGTFMKVA